MSNFKERNILLQSKSFQKQIALNLYEKISFTIKFSSSAINYKPFINLLSYQVYSFHKDICADIFYT